MRRDPEWENDVRELKMNVDQTKVAIKYFKSFRFCNCLVAGDVCQCLCGGALQRMFVMVVDVVDRVHNLAFRNLITFHVSSVRISLKWLVICGFPTLDVCCHRVCAICCVSILTTAHHWNALCARVCILWRVILYSVYSRRYLICNMGRRCSNDENWQPMEVVRNNTKYEPKTYDNDNAWRRITHFE